MPSNKKLRGKAKRGFKKGFLLSNPVSPPSATIDTTESPSPTASTPTASTPTASSTRLDVPVRIVLSPETLASEIKGSPTSASESPEDSPTRPSKVDPNYPLKVESQYPPTGSYLTPDAEEMLKQHNLSFYVENNKRYFPTKRQQRQYDCLVLGCNEHLRDLYDKMSVDDFLRKACAAPNPRRVAVALEYIKKYDTQRERLYTIVFCKDRGYFTTRDRIIDGGYISSFFNGLIKRPKNDCTICHETIPDPQLEFECIKCSAISCRFCNSQWLHNCISSGREKTCPSCRCVVPETRLISFGPNDDLLAVGKSGIYVYRAVERQGGFDVVELPPGTHPYRTS